MDEEPVADNKPELSCAVFFTKSFPFATGEEFIETEISYLAEAFDRVVVVPTDYASHLIQTRPVPDNVQVIVPHRRTRSGSAAIRDVLLHALTHPQDVLRAATTSTREFPALAHARDDFKFDLISRVRAGGIARQIADALADSSSLVFYGYWFHIPTRVAIDVRRRLKLSQIPVVSRAHGFDLYAERHGQGYLPQRKFLLDNVESVFTVSKAGERYLSDRYPFHRLKLATRYLGVGPAISAGNPDRNPFTVVSCSNIVPVKRIHMLIDGLSEAQKRGLSVMWRHIGTGAPDYVAQVREYAEQRLTPETLEFIGALGNEEVRAWYGQHPSSVFVNTSESEGLPVSIMEALAQGLPVVATDVGGTSEIIDPESGLFDGLLAADHSPADFADRLEALFTADRATYSGYVAASLDRWARNWASQPNYTAFSQDLRDLAHAIRR